MTVIIENDILKATIEAKGAELSSVFHKEHQLEYMWSGDAAYWGKKSPVLFPIVGTLKDDSYFFNGKKYQLSRHGFARDYTFEVENHTADKVSFLLVSDAETLKNYPFEFEFRLHYTLEGNELSVTYDIENTSNQEMFFSVGGHPAFKVPLVEGTSYEDYYIQLNQSETVGRYPLSNDGLLLTESNPFLIDSDHFALKPSLFHEDAIVLKELKSDKMAILSDKTPHGLRITYEDFPFFGIWAAKNAPFVCLEPWCGVADSVNTTQDLTKKEGINALKVDDSFLRTWAIECF